jgi:hypothetical protein
MVLGIDPNTNFVYSLRWQQMMLPPFYVKIKDKTRLLKDKKQKRNE